MYRVSAGNILRCRELHKPLWKRLSLPPEGNDLLLGNDVLEVLLGPLERHLLDGLGCFPRVLEVDPGKYCLIKCDNILVQPSLTDKISLVSIAIYS